MFLKWPVQLESKAGLTLRDEGSDQAGQSSYDVGGGKGNSPPHSFNSEEDEEACRELHQTWDEEVNVEVSSWYPHPHDEALIDHLGGEPAERGAFHYSHRSRHIFDPIYPDLPDKHENQGVFPHIGGSEEVQYGSRGGITFIIISRQCLEFVEFEHFSNNTERNISARTINFQTCRETLR